MIGIDVIVGAVTGLVGSIVTTGGNIIMQKTKNKHEREMINLQTQAMLAEAEANIKITQAQVEGEIELADAKAYIESQKQSDKTLFDSKWIDRLMGGRTAQWLNRLLNGNTPQRIIGTIIASIFGFIERVIGVAIAVSFAFVDALKAFIRPSVTIYFLAVSTWVTAMAWEIMQAHSVEMSTGEAIEIFKEMMLMVKYLTVSCVTWWFADRRLAKFLMRLNKS